MSAADCPGCGLPVATPADAGSWTPDGTVCWRGGRCEVSAADEESALCPTGVIFAIGESLRSALGAVSEYPSISLPTDC